jgi:hypothetical protein
LKNSVRLQPSYLSFWLNKHRNFLVEWSAKKKNSEYTAETIFPFHIHHHRRTPIWRNNLCSVNSIVK